MGPLDSRLLGQTASVTVLDRNGEVLYEPVAASGSRRTSITAAELPPRVVEATLAAEDRRFFLHPGIDPIAVAHVIARARRWWTARVGRG